eukprot:4546281-Prymnesium_polylepis.1
MRSGTSQPIEVRSRSCVSCRPPVTVTGPCPRCTPRRRNDPQRVARCSRTSLAYGCLSAQHEAPAPLTAP